MLHACADLCGDQDVGKCHVDCIKEREAAKCPTGPPGHKGATFSSPALTECMQLCLRDTKRLEHCNSGCKDMHVRPCLNDSSSFIETCTEQCSLKSAGNSLCQNFCEMYAVPQCAVTLWKHLTDAGYNETDADSCTKSCTQSADDFTLALKGDDVGNLDEIKVNNIFNGSCADSCKAAINTPTKPSVLHTRAYGLYEQVIGKQVDFPYDVCTHLFGVIPSGEV